MPPAACRLPPFTSSITLLPLSVPAASDTIGYARLLISHTEFTQHIRRRSMFVGSDLFRVRPKHVSSPTRPKSSPCAPYSRVPATPTPLHMLAWPEQLADPPPAQRRLPQPWLASSSSSEMRAERVARRPYVQGFAHSMRPCGRVRGRIRGRGGGKLLAGAAGAHDDRGRVQSCTLR